MKLKKLEIQGFKSFAQKTVFIFDEPMTAIVGPNGSGKSNVSDAIRWVLGEQSLKLLRGKRAEDVIFHGSHKSSRMSLAEVNLHIDNQDGKLPIDYSEVVITRRLFRNGNSDYLINKKNVRLADILLLLAKANFGQKSYAVIGQGMIDKILIQSSEDRKEFFDEASGVKQYQIKRDQSVNKLLKTVDNLEQAESLIKEIEPRLNYLKRLVRKLEKREIISKELKQKQYDYYGYIWKTYNQDMKNTVAKAIEIERDKDANDQELEEIQSEIDALAAEEGREDIFKTLQNEYNLINNDKNKLIKEQTVLRGKLEVEQEKHGEMKLSWLSNRREEIKNKIVDLENSSNTNQRQVTKLGELLTLKIREQEKFQAEYKDIEYQLLKTREDLTNSAAGISMPELKAKLKDIINQHKNFVSSVKKAETPEEWAKIKSGANKISKDLDVLLSDVSTEDKEEYSRLKAKSDQLQNKLEEFLSKKDNLINEITELKIDQQSKERELSVSQQDLSSLQLEKDSVANQIKEIQTTLDDKLDEDSKLKKFQKKFEELEKLLEENQNRLNDVQTRIDNFNQEEQKKKEIILEKQSRARELQNQINQISNQFNSVNIEKAKLETKIEDLNIELKEEINPEEISRIKDYSITNQIDTDTVRNEIVKLRKQIEQIGGIDPEIQQEFESTNERYEFLTTQTKDMRESVGSLNEIIEKLDKTIRKQFNKSFKKINENFSKYFKVLFVGGTAKLKLVTEEEDKEEQEKIKQEEMAASGVDASNIETDTDEEEDTLAKYLKHKKKNVSGIDIIAQPPNKKIRTIAGLSGGEKSLTSLALLCAIINSNPPPFIVLDEVEAALDEANSEKFIAIVKKFSEKTQFIVITHNRVTINHADILYGVTMGNDGISKILSVKLEDIEKKKLLETGKVKAITD